MSVANILGADGRIKALYLPAGGSGGGVTNPLTSDLLCAGFEVAGASYLRTDIVELETLEPKAPQTFVECVGDFSVAPTKAVDTDRLRVDVLEARTGATIETVDPLAVAESLTLKGTGGVSNVLFADLSGNISAVISGFPNGTIDITTGASERLRLSASADPKLEFNPDGAPAPSGLITYRGVTQDFAIDKPVILDTSGNAPFTLNYTGATLPNSQQITFSKTGGYDDGGFAYVHSASPATGQFVLNHSTQIRDPGTLPRIFLISDASGFVSNGQLVYDTTTQRMNVTRDFEVRGTGGAPTAGLRIGPVVNPVTLTYAQATSTLTADKQVRFDAFCPLTAIAPTVGDSLTNKTYVDVGVRFKSQREYFVSKQGNNTTGNGSANAPYLTIQKAIDEAQLSAGGITAFDVINVAPGQYIENLVMTRGYMTIQGNKDTFRPSGTTIIQGQIVIQLGGVDDLFNKSVNITGLSINGHIIDNSTCQHSVSLASLNIFNSTGAAPAILFQPSAGMTDARLYVDRCFINHIVNATAVAIRVGQLYMSNTLIDVTTNNSALALLDNAIGALGGVASQVVLCQFANSNNSATLSPLVLLNSNNTNIHAFGNCSFIYSNAAVKSASPNSSGVLFDGASNMTANVAQCVFALAGTTHPANSVIMKSAAATGTMVLFNTANEALNGLAHKVDAGIVKLNSTVVN